MSDLSCFNSIFELFPRNELEGIPSIAPLIKKVQKIEDVTSYEDLEKSVKEFSNRDINFLHSPLVDGLYKGFTRQSPAQETLFEFHPAPSVESMIKRLVNNDKYLPAVKWLVEKFHNLVDIETLIHLTSYFESSSTLQYLCDKKELGENSVKKCLQNSVENGLEKNIIVLLSKLVDFTNLGETFLLACEKGNLSIIDIFIQKGIVPDKNALFIACKNKNHEILNLLLEHVNINEVKDFLFIACCQYDIPEILKKVFDPSQPHKNNFGMILACTQGNTKIVKFLLENKVPKSEIFLNKAISHNHLEIVKLFNSEINENSLILACHRQHLEILDYLLNFVNINFEDGYLIKTCYGREHLPKSAEFLVKKGILASKEIIKNAVYKGDIEVVKNLLKISSFTTMHLLLAVKTENIAMCELLLKNGVQINMDVVKLALSKKNKKLLEILKNYISK